MVSRGEAEMLHELRNNVPLNFDLFVRRPIELRNVSNSAKAQGSDHALNCFHESKAVHTKLLTKKNESCCKVDLTCCMQKSCHEFVNFLFIRFLRAKTFLYILILIVLIFIDNSFLCTFVYKNSQKLIRVSYIRGCFY